MDNLEKIEKPPHDDSKRYEQIIFDFKSNYPAPNWDRVFNEPHKTLN